MQTWGIIVTKNNWDMLFVYLVEHHGFIIPNIDQFGGQKYYLRLKTLGQGYIISIHPEYPGGSNHCMLNDKQFKEKILGHTFPSFANPFPPSKGPCLRKWVLEDGIEVEYILRNEKWWLTGARRSTTSNPSKKGIKCWFLNEDGCEYEHIIQNGDWVSTGEKRLISNSSANPDVILFESINTQREKLDLPPIERPPLGLVPQKTHDEKRQNAILEAMNRYVQSNKSIPIEWVVEFNQISERQTRK